MKIIGKAVCGACLALMGIFSFAYAATESQDEHVGMYSPGLEAEWKQGLQDKNLVPGANAGDIFVAVGREPVAFPMSHPGFLESRSVAYEIAYLRAKIDMVKYLGIAIEQSNSYETLENAQWSDGQGEALDRIKQLDRISRKLKDLAEVQIDKTLSDMDPNHDPDKYGSREEKETTIREVYKRKIREVASSFVSGALPLEVLEGPTEDGNSYEVLVGLVWSPRLESAAKAVAGGYAPKRSEKVGVRIADWLPKDRDSIAASWGVHKLTDEIGDQVFIGFGQASPRKVSPSRRSKAEQSALRRAELRAKGAIRGFVGEVVRSETAEEGEQVSIEYLDASYSGAVGGTLLEKLESQAKSITLTGLTVVGRWVLPHPANEEKVAVVAVSWSPRGLATAQRVLDAMRRPEKKPEPSSKSETTKPTPKLLRKENIKVEDL